MKQNKIKVAVTGGIGSGKSSVCKIIQEMGYPVYSCDETYNELINSGKLLSDLVKEFGGEIVDSDGGLNRKKLSEIVFADKEKLEKLNKITHGKIFETMFFAADKSGERVNFFEVPLLFEGGYGNLFDEVIVILRNREERVSSVIKRDNLTREQVESRLNNQFNYDNNNLTKYFVIHNDGNFDELYSKIKDILLKITNR